MLLARQNRIGSVRSLFTARRVPAINIRHISHEEQKRLLTKHPDLNDQTARKKILERYINRCANLGVTQDSELRKIRLSGFQLEQFVRLRSNALAVRLLESKPSEKLARQYAECERWLKDRVPRAEKLYEAERDAILKQFPQLAIAAMRENTLKQYDMESKRILIPRSEQERPDGSQAFVAGTTHEEKRRFCELALQYVAIHLIDNPITSKEALERWKTDFKNCKDTLAKAEVYSIEEERTEALEKYPELKDSDTLRKVLEEYESLKAEVIEAYNHGVEIPSPQYPPKKLEKFLHLQLKALAAKAFLPDSESAERMKKRREMREQCVAHLDELQIEMKKKKGGWWIIPNPLAIIEWIGIGI